MQDHLAKNGLKTIREQGARGMWFLPGDMEGFVSPGWSKGMDRLPYDFDKLGGLDDGGGFVVRNLGSAIAARREAQQNKDVNQRESFVWHNFIFESRRAKLAEIKKVLP